MSVSLRRRIRVLTLVPHYLPGFRAGGPIRTIANLVDHLGAEFAFKIITSDHDLGSPAPYDSVCRNAWNNLADCDVFYASRHALRPAALRGLFHETPHDIVYLNSFFHPRFTILPLLLRRSGAVPPRPVIVAPRGEFAPSALDLAKLKKRVFITFAKAAGLYGDTVWQASSQHEADQIYKVFGCRVRVCIAPNLPPREMQAKRAAGTPVYTPERIRICFVGRISPMKNLDFAMKVLSRVQDPVQFDVYGPIEDTDYWENCQRLSNGVSANVIISYLGPLAPAELSQRLSSYDLLFLPSRGENFGHIILEAMLQGTPVLISDRTPWRGLERVNAGWDFPLDKLEPFVTAIETLYRTPRSGRAALRECAMRFARTFADRSDTIDATRQLFFRALSGYAVQY